MFIFNLNISYIIDRSTLSSTLSTLQGCLVTLNLQHLILVVHSDRLMLTIIWFSLFTCFWQTFGLPFNLPSCVMFTSALCLSIWSKCYLFLFYISYQPLIASFARILTFVYFCFYEMWPLLFSFILGPLSDVWLLVFCLYFGIKH